MLENFGRHVRALRTRTRCPCAAWPTRRHHPRLPEQDRERPTALGRHGPDAGRRPRRQRLPARGADVGQLPRPAQLPLAMSGFVGREPEIRDLTAALERPTDSRVPLIIAVDGPPGAGKTTLALHFAHRQYPVSRTASCTPTCADTARTTSRRGPRRCWPTCCGSLGVPAAGAADDAAPGRALPVGAGRAPDADRAGQRGRLRPGRAAAAGHRPVRGDHHQPGAAVRPHPAGQPAPADARPDVRDESLAC